MCNHTSVADDPVAFALLLPLSAAARGAGCFEGQGVAMEGGGGARFLNHKNVDNTSAMCDIALSPERLDWIGAAQVRQKKEETKPRNSGKNEKRKRPAAESIGMAFDFSQ